MKQACVAFLVLVLPLVSAAAAKEAYPSDKSACLMSEEGVRATCAPSDSSGGSPELCSFSKPVVHVNQGGSVFAVNQISVQGDTRITYFPDTGVCAYQMSDASGHPLSVRFKTPAGEVEVQADPAIEFYPNGLLKQSRPASG